MFFSEGILNFCSLHSSSKGGLFRFTWQPWDPVVWNPIKACRDISLTQKGYNGISKVSSKERGKMVSTEVLMRILRRQSPPTNILLHRVCSKPKEKVSVAVLTCHNMKTYPSSPTVLLSSKIARWPQIISGSHWGPMKAKKVEPLLL